jgi:ATP-binding cassette, subfamily B, bacterial
MDDLCRYAGRPLSFMFRYVRLRPGSHLLILITVAAAVACSVSTQYGVKFLVDTLSGSARDEPSGAGGRLKQGDIAAHKGHHDRTT